MDKKVIITVRDFSETPGPREKAQGDFSAELFVETILEPEFMKMDSDDEIVYRINQHELPLKRDGNRSEWIMQLMDKLWIDVATLYRLAQTIKQEYPENTIDWRET